MNSRHPEDNKLIGMKFNLPTEPEFNKAVLGRGDGTFDFRLGTSKWKQKEWLGQIYPGGTKEVSFLDEYIKRFNYVELHSTFYGQPKPEQLRIWKEKAEGRDFLFNVKMSQAISHIKKFANCQTELEAFFAAASELKLTVGSIWIQVPQNFRLQQLSFLLAWLDSLPTSYRYFLEFRNPDVFSNMEVFCALQGKLSAKGIGLIICDNPDTPELLHTALSIPEVMIRFSGISEDASQISRLNAWAQRISDWKGQGLEKVYFCYDQENQKNFAQDFRLVEDIFRTAGLHRGCQRLSV
jgi:uncharacterized protein YecE (DUF72 family)